MSNYFSFYSFFDYISRALCKIYKLIMQMWHYRGFWLAEIKLQHNHTIYQRKPDSTRSVKWRKKSNKIWKFVHARWQQTYRASNSGSWDSASPGTSFSWFPLIQSFCNLLNDFKLPWGISANWLLSKCL